MEAESLPGSCLSQNLPEMHEIERMAGRKRDFKDAEEKGGAATTPIIWDDAFGVRVSD